MSSTIAGHSPVRQEEKPDPLAASSAEPDLKVQATAAPPDAIVRSAPPKGAAPPLSAAAARSSSPR